MGGYWFCSFGRALHQECQWRQTEQENGSRGNDVNVGECCGLAGEGSGNYGIGLGGGAVGGDSLPCQGAGQAFDALREDGVSL